jgi:hypothetical protein
MQKIPEKLKERLNGECSDTFKNRYFGRFFTGDVTVRYDDSVHTFSIHLGYVVAVQAGVPITGIDIGVAGSAEDWKEFSDRKSLSVSTNKMNPHNLTLQGSPLRVRQNFNAVAYLCRVFSEILESVGEKNKG